MKAVDTRACHTGDYSMQQTAYSGMCIVVSHHNNQAGCSTATGVVQYICIHVLYWK